MGLLRSVTSLIAGRWQAPLALLAAGVAALALYQLRPPPRSMDFEGALAALTALQAAGRDVDAADAIGNLLADKSLARDQRRALCDQLAEILYRFERPRQEHTTENLEKIVEHHRIAQRLGLPADAHRALRIARTLDWLGRPNEALDAYEAVLTLDPAPDQRLASLQALVRLLDGRRGREADADRCLNELLVAENVSPAYVWWALQRGVKRALQADEPTAARELLERHGRRFTAWDLRGYYDFLLAWILIGEQRFDEAEPILATVDEWLAARRGAAESLDESGYLPALIRWLAGLLELRAGRPQAALERFDEALATQSHGSLAVQIAIDRSDALSLLDRHDDAERVLTNAIERVLRDGRQLSEDGVQLRRTVLRLAQTSQHRREHLAAIAYLKRALPLLPDDDVALRLDVHERLALECQAAADADAGVVRALAADAARHFEQAAELASTDDAHGAGLLWFAAREYERIGALADARRLLSRFAAMRPGDSRLPPVLLQLGRVCEALGDTDQALAAYEQLISRFGKLEEAARARLLRAECLLAMGPAHFARAESELIDLLESEYIAPEAPVFRDALLVLGESLYFQGRFADAISRLEDCLELYPREFGSTRARFMLADAYRQSAQQLRDNPPVDAPRERTAEETRARLRRAAELFGAIVAAADAARRDAALDPLDAAYERLALMHLGDCLLELNEIESLSDALALFRQVAARYQGDAIALTAQVQIANIYLRMGRTIEAARAVERARWLLNATPDEALAASPDGFTRAEWDRFLTAVAQADVFGDVFTAAN